MAGLPWRYCLYPFASSPPYSHNPPSGISGAGRWSCPWFSEILLGATFVFAGLRGFRLRFGLWGTLLVYFGGLVRLVLSFCYFAAPAYVAFLSTPCWGFFSSASPMQSISLLASLCEIGAVKKQVTSIWSAHADHEHLPSSHYWGIRGFFFARWIMPEFRAPMLSTGLSSLLSCPK